MKFVVTILHDVDHDEVIVISAYVNPVCKKCINDFNCFKEKLTI